MSCIKYTTNEVIKFSTKKFAKHVSSVKKCKKALTQKHTYSTQEVAHPSCPGFYFVLKSVAKNIFKYTYKKKNKTDSNQESVFKF